MAVSESARRRAAKGGEREERGDEGEAPPPFLRWKAGEEMVAVWSKPAAACEGDPWFDTPVRHLTHTQYTLVVGPASRFEPQAHRRACVHDAMAPAAIYSRPALPRFHSQILRLYHQSVES